MLTEQEHDWEAGVTLPSIACVHFPNLYRENAGTPASAAAPGAHRGGLLHVGDGRVEQEQRQDEREVRPVEQRGRDDGRRLHRPRQRVPHVGQELRAPKQQR